MIESINQKSLYIVTLNQKNPASINKKMLNKNKIAKILDIKHIIIENKYNTLT